MSIISDELSNLNALAYYHASITNSEIKKLLVENGDFVLRNSLHQKDKFSLSVLWNSRIHHIRINEILNKSNKRDFYIYEAHEKFFNTIDELVKFYVSSAKILNDETKLRIIRPVKRAENIVNRAINNESDDENDYDNVTPSEPRKTNLTTKLQSIKLNAATGSEKFAAPAKPTRAPTIREKRTKPQVYRRDDIIQLQQRQKENDITMPLFSLFRSSFNVSEYHCELISDRNKRLDRHALNEIANIFKYGCAESLGTVFGEQLAVLLSKEDLEIIKYNRDFGLGIFNGIELLCLPHGSFIRYDAIERWLTFELFIAVSLCLAPSSDERVNQLIAWIDCAYYLFDKFKNFYAFTYVMAALNHKEIKRLSDLWSQLKIKNEIKHNLFNVLNRNLELLLKGEYLVIEKEALIPNIYAIALLLLDNSSISMTRDSENSDEKQLVNDFKFYMPYLDVYLSSSARYIISNTKEYALRSEQFLNEHYMRLFPSLTKASMQKRPSKGENNVYTNTLKRNENANEEQLKKLKYIAHTEFHEIVLWSSDFGNYLSQYETMSFDEKMNARFSDINKILKIFSLKIQQA